MLILKVFVSPLSTSVTVGVKLYAASSATVVAGLPVITGASFSLVTVRLNAAKLSVTLLPSVTVITMPLVTPTSSLVGVPDNKPVAVLKFAQLGLLVILKISLSPTSASDTVGMKL